MNEHLATLFGSIDCNYVKWIFNSDSEAGEGIKKKCIKNYLKDFWGVKAHFKVKNVLIKSMDD